MSIDKRFLIIGGGGMIGYQIARHICVDSELKPDEIIIASLYQSEVQEAIRNLKQLGPGVTITPFWGNVFVRTEMANEDRNRLVESPPRREALYNDLFGNMEETLSRSQLASLIMTHKPHVIVDAVNTATAISYQDVASTSAKLRRTLVALQSAVPDHIYHLKELLQRLENPDDQNASVPKEDLVGTLKELQHFLELFKTREGSVREPSLQETVEALILSQAVPQLIRHTLILYEAMKRAGTRLYIKVGTTGTGGMGLNIPYTHSEAKPSAQLMSKTAVAFAHTGLLFLMARTPDAPIVKEIKPAAMVGYQKVAMQTVKKRDGSARVVFTSRMESLNETLRLRLSERDFEKKSKLKMVGVDTGENGFFALGEFEAITSMKQMEFTTPEEIAEVVVLEIKGRNTGLEVIAGLNASVMNPSYRAGFLRHLVVDRVRELDERVGGKRSVALRDLGPPELSKLLYEAHILALEYKRLDEVITHTASNIAAAAEKRLTEDAELRDQITSIGIPILLSDGKTFWRGPFIAYPEAPSEPQVKVTAKEFEQWVKRGWIDLRPKNFEVWLEWIGDILRKRREQLSRHDEGSATYSRKFYSSDEILIGEIVGWIFNNKMEGYRIME
jgi:regulator of replication initiation timing